jgi:glycosyltransferase involved in cell wall biosynthesis
MGPISVLVCTRNRADSLIRTVRSLLATDLADYELIVIDQSDGIDSSAKLPEVVADSRLQYVPTTSRGKGAALNEGLRRARGAIVVCTDDDCEAPSGWALAMTRTLEAQPTAAMLFCNVIAAPCDWTAGYTPAYERQQSAMVRSLIGTCAGHGMGAGMAVRRDVVLAMGGFDEIVGPGGRFPSADDWDLEHRVLLRGWHVYESADLAVLHHGFRTLKEGRQHAYRDWFAIGGVCAKPLRAGHISAAVVAAWYLVAYAVWPVFVDVASLRRPHGKSRITGFIAGFAEGIRIPVDRHTLLFRSRVTTPQDSVSSRHHV